MPPILLALTTAANPSHAVGLVHGDTVDILLYQPHQCLGPLT